MEPLSHAFGRVVPQLQIWVALVGKVPAGTVTIVALIALWVAVRWLAPFALVLPGLVAGSAFGAWLALALGWHPLLAIFAGVLVATGVFQILGAVFLVRLGLAVIVAPAAVWAVWHFAAGALDTAWALVITAIAAGSVASLARRLIESDNYAAQAWATSLIDDLRGD